MRPDCGCKTGDDYRRTSRYVGLRVKDVDIYSILGCFLEKSNNKKNAKNSNDTFMFYCVERLLRIYKIWEPDNWEFDVSRGYYGQEIDRIRLCSFGDIKADILKLLSLKPNDRIKFVLEKEYGYVLDAVDRLDFEEIEISVSDIIVSNEEYRKKVEVGLYDLSQPNLLIGISLTKFGTDDKYKIIDGYHRFVDLTKNKEIVNIICAVAS